MGLCILAVNQSKQHLAMLKYCKKYNIKQSILNLQLDNIDDQAYGKLDKLLLKTKPEDLSKDQQNWLKRELYKHGIAKQNDPNIFSKENREALEDKMADDLYNLFDMNITDFYYNIGYGGFYYMRNGLAPFFKCEYYTDTSYEKFEDQFRFKWPDELDAPKNHVVVDFFLHSDCDGYFSEQHIKQLAHYFKEHKIRQQVKQYWHGKNPNNAWQPEALKFCDFVQKSANGDYAWIFG